MPNWSHQVKQSIVQQPHAVGTVRKNLNEQVWTHQDGFHVSLQEVVERCEEVVESGSDKLTLCIADLDLGLPTLHQGIACTVVLQKWDFKKEHENAKLHEIQSLQEKH